MDPEKLFLSFVVAPLNYSRATQRKGKQATHRDRGNIGTEKIEPAEKDREGKRNRETGRTEGQRNRQTKQKEKPERQRDREKRETEKKRKTRETGRSLSPFSLFSLTHAVSCFGLFLNC